MSWSYPPERGWKTVGDLIAAAKMKPGALNFSSVGVGSATHLSAELFRRSAGVDAVHVPFKGGAEAMTEVIAGRIDFFFGPVGLVLPNIQDGKLRALVVNRSQAVVRTARRPDNAGMRESQTPSIRFGLGCSCPPRRHARSSKGCTTKPSRRSSLQRFATSWPRSESIRWRCHPLISPLMCKEKSPPTRTW